MSQLRRPCEDRLFEAKLAALPPRSGRTPRTALRTPAEKRNEVQKYLAEKFEAALTVKPEEVTASLSSEEKAAAAQLEAQISRDRGQPAQVGQDSGPL